METLLALIGLLITLFILGGVIVAWISFAKIRSADEKIKELTLAVLHLKSLVKKLSDNVTENQLSQSPPTEFENESQPAQQSSKPILHEGSPEYQARETENLKATATNKPPIEQENKTKVSLAERLEMFLANNGLLWIGGVILALGGVFLAKYSIESGLISITVRLIIGGVFATSLVVLAEYLYRKHQGNAEYITTCAALASGGVITGFALVLVTFSYYQFISPFIAFAGLGVISLLATALALRFGPLLAVIGIIGAYAVPALVSTGSNNVFALLLYVNFVSLAAIWVVHKVAKQWLWWQSFVGHFLWLSISVFIADNADIWIILATIFVGLYLYVVSSVLGWRLTRINAEALPIKILLMPRKEQLAIVLSVLLLSLFYILHSFNSSLIIVTILLSCLCLYLPLRHSAFDLWPFVSLLFNCFVILNYPPPIELTDSMLTFSGMFLFAQVMAISYFVYAVVFQKVHNERPSFSLLLATGPVLLFALSYIVAPNEVETALYSLWTLYLVMIAGYALWQTTRSNHVMAKITFWILANTNLALVASMWLNASTLTLAICSQLVLIAYGQKRFSIDLPLWLSKIALTLVMTRITLSPWTAKYSNETIVGVHWSLIVLPIITALVYFAYRLHTNLALKKWYEGALVHLVALFVTTETSYFLVGRYPDFNNLNFAELAVLSMNWLLLAAVYCWRYKLNERKLYLYAALGITIASALAHVVINTHYNPFLTSIAVGEYFFLNWLLVIWAAPAIVLGVVYHFNLQPSILKISKQKLLLPLIAVFGFLFINGVIRDYFQVNQIWLKLSTSQAEIYAYSVVWLMIAAGFILLGQQRNKAVLYQSGFVILLVVILKAFLFDMAHFDGLYRAISFIGLGLSLVALGWLFTRFKLSNKEDVK
ncbi:DUF2339 domain-containing protein [Pseudoalteromonas sp.]|uniref:DUF2339 domain-containing protein n=1 Tax=Pseudoalteromonas sp. TaxID=53249 RepID=UPI0035644890